MSRISTGYFSSSGTGGAKLHRRDFGEIIENVCVTSEYHCDAKGTFLAGVGASPVYALLGKKGLKPTEFPEIETPLADGDLAYRQHAGGHTDGPNWPTFLDFAARYWEPK